MKQKTLFTIGYEDTTVDGMIAALQKAGVAALIDVRAVPQSRKPGFSKNRLIERLSTTGIEYVGLKGLGTPAKGRDAARKGRIAEMRSIFRRHMETDAAQEDLKQAIDVAKTKPACLLCFEHAPGMCHRMIVAEMMAEETGMKIAHLDPVNG
jgi:uncharacterized protein (DUF488 family)